MCASAFFFMQNVCVCLCVCGPAVLAHLARMRYHDSHARTLSTIQQPISIASPLLGRLICIFTLPLKNHNAMSPGCILGARRVYRRCPVSSCYTWNIGVEHVDKLSGPPSLFLPHSLVFSVPPHPPLSFPTSTRTSVFFFLHNRHTNAVTSRTLGAQTGWIPLKRRMRVDCVRLGTFVCAFLCLHRDNYHGSGAAAVTRIQKQKEEEEEEGGRLWFNRTARENKCSYINTHACTHTHTHM